MPTALERAMTLPVFLVGGGAQNDLHRRRIEALHAWLGEHARNDGYACSIFRSRGMLIYRYASRISAGWQPLGD